jgi:AraC family transcriptional regulator
MPAPGPTLNRKRGAVPSGEPFSEVRARGYRHTPFLVRPALPLSGMITSVGYSLETTPQYDWRGLERGNSEFALLQHTLSGRGRLDFEGESFTVEPGVTMLLHIPHDHRYFLPAGSRWEFFYLCLNGSEVMRLWREVVARRGPLVRLDPTSPTLQRAAHACSEVLRGNVQSAFVASSLAHGLALSLVEEAFAEDEEESPRFTRKIAAFCRKNLRRPIGVDDMAKAAGMSRYHFSRKFHQASGMPPAKFLTEIRLSHAVELIRAETGSVTTIAAETGFSDVNYFCKVFRKRFGVSPGAFRKNGMYSQG